MDSPRQMELFYRPVYDWDYQAPAGWQSQLRITSPDMGLLMPEQYLPVSERTNQCCQLADWALEQALTDAAELTGRGVELEWVSVYISVRMLGQADFLDTVKRHLAQSGWPAEKLCLEFPPELLFSDDETAAGNLRRARALGIHAMLAGFGTAFCPVMKLLETPCDWVLLAPEVPADFRASGRRREATLSLIRLLQGQDVRVVADAVDSEETAEALAAEDCLWTAGGYAGKYRRARQIR